MSENASTLEAACDQYVGRTLIVEPHYGYGWYHPPGGPLGDHGVPTPFHLRVERVYCYKHERRGVLARVTEPGFVYDGFWLVSMTRHIGVWNFTDRPAWYNLLLCPEEPVAGKEEDSPEVGKLWPVWHLRGQPQASGFGRMAESLECCAEYDARQDTEAKHGGSQVFRYTGTVRLDRSPRVSLAGQPPEDIPMSSRPRVLVVASILAVAVALAAVLIWQPEAHRVALQTMLGVGLVGLGVAFTVLHLTVSDDLLRRHFGEPGAAEMRRVWRGGWVGVLLGAALLGVLSFDRWVQSAGAGAAFNRGLDAAKVRDWPTATEAFSEAIRRDPTDARAYRQRGAVYLQQEEHDRAIADFDEALRLAPEDAPTLFNRGLVYYRKQDYARALSDFGGAIRLNPGYKQAYLARSNVYAKQGEDARANADRQKAAELAAALEKSGGSNP